MKTKIIIALVAIVEALGLAGCKPRETTATGQIFIVTRGAENIKLGAVEVLLIEKPQVTHFLANKEPIIDAEIASRQQEYTIAEEDHKKAYAAYAPYNPFEKEKIRENAENNLDKATVNSLADAAFAAEDRMKADKIKLENSHAAENYFRDFLPVATQETLSDADGKFSFVYPRDKSFTIYASARRATLNGTEEYYWLIDAPTNAETVQVFLSNNNLVSVDPDDYFKLKPE